MRWPRARYARMSVATCICLWSNASSRSSGLDVPAPAHLLVGHAEGAEHVVVEVVPAQQPLVHGLQEHAGLGALDDAVVVRGGEGHDLRDGQLADRPLVGPLPRGRVVDAAHADDDALPGHEPGNGLHGTDRPRVGDRQRRALEVRDLQLAGLRPADQVLVGGPEPGEVEGVGLLDDGDDEAAGAVGLLHVDGDADVHVLVAHEARRAIGSLDERRVHGRHVVGDRAHDGVGDDVGEADLAAAGPAEVAVDHLAVDLEQLGRDVAEAGRRRDPEAALHVGDDERSRATDRRAGVLGGAPPVPRSRPVRPAAGRPVAGSPRAWAAR